MLSESNKILNTLPLSNCWGKGVNTFGLSTLLMEKSKLSISLSSYEKKFFLLFYSKRILITALVTSVFQWSLKQTFFRIGNRLTISSSAFLSSNPILILFSYSSIPDRFTVVVGCSFVCSFCEKKS